LAFCFSLIVWRARAEEGNEEVELDMGGQGFDIDFGGAEDFVPDEIQEQEEEEMVQFSLSQVRDSNVCVRCCGDVVFIVCG
jgi:hypothetical protein